MSSVNVICGIPLNFDTVARLLEADMVWRWAPAISYAVGLLVATRLWSNLLIVPASGVLAILVCHSALFLLGISMEEARASGILYVGMPSGATWPPMGIQDFALVDGSVVASQVPGIVGVVLVTLMSIVLNSRALEAAIGVDFDLDREFRVGGVACLLAGMGGSPPGCNANTMCLITHATGAQTRLTGIFTALVVGSVLITDGDLLAILPSPLLGGMVLFVALGVLNDWLVITRDTMPRTDYCNVPEPLYSVLRRCLPEGERRALDFAEDLDRGLERCEDLLILEWDRQNAGSDAARSTLLGLAFDQALRDTDRQARFEALTEQLGPWLEDRVYTAGENVVARGERQPGMQFLVEGRVTKRDGEAGPRVDEFGQGDALMPQAAFEDHVAESCLAAESPCRTVLLTPPARRSIERGHPELAVDLDRYLMETFLAHRASPPPVPAS